MRAREAEEILSAAGEWKEKCLVNGGSLFGEERLWNNEHFQELYRCYVENPIWDSSTFIEKLKIQLEPATGKAKRLWSEMEWLYYLIVSNVKRETKLDKIKTPWEWSGADFPDDSPFVGDLLSKGTVNGGYGFNTNKWREMRFIVEGMAAWFSLSEDARSSLIQSPWEFTDWLDSQPYSQSSLFRHALLFFLFPDSFEDIVSRKHKQKIVESFNTKSGDGSNTKELTPMQLDQRLLEVRSRLNDENPSIEVSFYSSPFYENWNPSDDSPPTPVGTSAEWFEERFNGANAWLIAPGEGARLWTDFVNSEVVAIGWDDLGDLSAFSTQDDMQDELTKHGFGKTASHMTWNFCREMSVGDVVVAKKGRSAIVGYGVVSGEYIYDDERPEYRNVRSIDWQQSHKPIELKHKVAMKTLTPIDKSTEWLRSTIEAIDENAEVVPDTNTPRVEPYDVTMAMGDVFLDETQLQRILDAIALRKNLVLQGPPGVGKTYIARRIAWVLLGAKDSTRLEFVQFHQTYSYEDFVQGWRPTDSGGFELRNGVFFNFCKKAEERPDQPFVFIIDEINRGNLSRVFGELLMLIEYDKRGPEHSVALTYSDSGDTFFVPENVHILGLMNTADRSLAIVDYALRRRFAFETLDPAFGKPQFRDHLIEIGVDRDLVNQIESKLKAVNERIRADSDLGQGYEIGHSYFVPEGEPDERWFRVVIETQIAPLLREYWFDHPSRVDELVKELLP